MNSMPENKTIKETLMTALLFDGFWDRWIAHGVKKEDLQQIRSQFVNLDGWTSGEVCGASIPARLIGGDYYDFYSIIKWQNSHCDWRCGGERNSCCDADDLTK